jgi:hypothetical protein
MYADPVSTRSSGNGLLLTAEERIDTTREMMKRRNGNEF